MRGVEEVMSALLSPLQHLHASVRGRQRAGGWKSGEPRLWWCGSRRGGGATEADDGSGDLPTEGGGSWRSRSARKETCRGRAEPPAGTDAEEPEKRGPGTARGAGRRIPPWRSAGEVGQSSTADVDEPVGSREDGADWPAATMAACCRGRLGPGYHHGNAG